MFNGDLRDKLLFEDAEFTYSRRYFWAFQTLGLMNDSIKAIVKQSIIVTVSFCTHPPTPRAESQDPKL